MITYQGTGYTIYKHTNKVNGKVYIGLTKCKDLTRRWAGGHGYKQCKFFFSAIVRYGWLNFDHEILETGIQTKAEAAEREKHYVKEYRSRNPRYGYNIQEGGFNSKAFSAQGYKNAVANFQGNTGCPVVIFDADGKRLKEYKTMSDATRFLGCGMAAISRSCTRGRGTCRGYIVRYAVEVEGVEQLPEEEIFKPHAQPGTWSPVAMYDLNGKYIQRFKSITEASAFVGCKPHNISCCLSKLSSQKATRGYMWQYIKDGDCPDSIPAYSRKKSNPNNKVRVCQYDRFTGKKMNTYASYSAAANACHCKLDSIRNNVLGLTKTAAGYIWRLESEGLESVEPIPVRGGRWDREPA